MGGGVGAWLAPPPSARSHRCAWLYHKSVLIQHHFASTIPVSGRALVTGSRIDTRSSRPAEPTAPSGEEDDIDFGKFIQAVSRRRRLAVTVLVASLLAGSAITAWQRAFRPTFAGGFQLLVSDPINDEGQRGSSLEDVALAGGGRTKTDTLVRVLGSPLLLKPVEDQLKLGAGSLSGALSIAGGEDGVLGVNLQWSDPVEGQAILSKLTAAFLNYSLRQRQEKLNQGLSFLDQQAPELQQRVNRLQEELAEFRRVNAFVEPGEQADYIIKQRQALASQIEKLQQEQARLEGRLASIRSGRLGTSAGSYRAISPQSVAQASSPPSQNGAAAVAGQPSEPASESVSNTPLESLYDVERALVEARANFTDDSPQVLELKAKRDRIKPLLQNRQANELLADLNQNLVEQNQIKAQMAKFTKSFQGSPTLIKKYQELQQELEVALGNLGSYIKARENFRLQVAQRTVPWSVLNPPVFGSQPVKPTMSRNLLLSLLLGTGGGIAAALLRDRLDPVFHDPGELKEALPLPLLGVVPHLPDAKELTVAKAVEVMDGGQRFETRESLRNLFANFRLLRADKTVRLVALTSATQGEGKSTTTSLFALTLAQLGERVLLVDADMRRPMLHNYVGAENGKGLSSLLTDASLHPANCVVPVLPGLDLLPAGPMPPDTTRLLSSARCGEVVKEIRDLPDYDLVLFDTPPAFLLSDPVLLAGHLDGLLFVVGMERVNRDLPGQALERIQGTGVDVLGVLANLPNRRRGSNRGYGYGYGYGYGNRYGYKNSYARYGGYQELANRYHAVDAEEPDKTSPVLEQKRSSNGKRPSLIALKARKMVKWLDRRD